MNPGVSIPEVPVVPENNSEDVCCWRHGWWSVSWDIHVAAAQGAAFLGWGAAGIKQRHQLLSTPMQQAWPVQEQHLHRIRFQY